MAAMIVNNLELAYLDAMIEKQEAICSLNPLVAEARIILEERLATSSKSNPLDPDTRMSIRMKLDNSDDAWVSFWGTTLGQSLPSLCQAFDDLIVEFDNIFRDRHGRFISLYFIMEPCLEMLMELMSYCSLIGTRESGRWLKKSLKEFLLFLTDYDDARDVFTWLWITVDLFKDNFVPDTELDKTNQVQVPNSLEVTEDLHPDTLEVTNDLYADVDDDDFSLDDYEYRDTRVIAEASENVCHKFQVIDKWHPEVCKTADYLQPYRLIFIPTLLTIMSLPVTSFVMLTILLTIYINVIKNDCYPDSDKPFSHEDFEERCSKMHENSVTLGHRGGQVHDMFHNSFSPQTRFCLG